MKTKPRETVMSNTPNLSRIDFNLVPRVLWLFGQRVGASRDSGVLEFCYRKISVVKQWKSLQGSQSKNLIFFELPRVSTGAHPLTKKPEDSGYEIGSTFHRVDPSYRESGRDIQNGSGVELPEVITRGQRRRCCQF